MKPRFILALLHFATGATVLAQNATYVAQEIALIPPCGLACLEHTIPEVGCSLTNTTCQCESKRLVQLSAACMMANCTLEETLELSKIQGDICQRPYESQNRKIRIMTIVCAIITNSAALLRFVSRIVVSHSFGSDDWFIAAAVVSDGIFAAIGVQLERHGFGEHVWNINLANVPGLLHDFYVCELLYVMTIGLVKISILFFYLRVFPKRGLRIACWLTMAFCASTTVAFGLVTVFQCHPITYVWDKDLKGKCVNYNSVAWSNAAINILQDIIIILLPMNELRNLQLNKKKKIGMYAMFGVGSFVCVTSMIRLKSLTSFGLTADPTWDNIPTTFWSTLETSTAVLCACMPSIRALLVYVFPALLGGTNHAVTMTSKIPPFAEDESGASRIAYKPDEKSISLLPLNMRTRLGQSSKTEGPALSATNAGGATLSDIKSKPFQGVIRIANLSYLERNKPLPLTPASTYSPSPSLFEDMEKPGARSSLSADTNRLL